MQTKLPLITPSRECLHCSIYAIGILPVLGGEPSVAVEGKLAVPHLTSCPPHCNMDDPARGPVVCYEAHFGTLQVMSVQQSGLSP